MKTFGSSDAPTELYKEAEINGEVYEFWTRIPAFAMKKATDLMSKMYSPDNFVEDDAEGDDVKEVEGKDGTKKKYKIKDMGGYMSALMEAIPYITPKKTAEQLLPRLKGEQAPIITPAVAVELGFWLTSTEDDEEVTGKAEPGAETSEATGSPKKAGRKSAEKPSKADTD